MHKPYTSSRLEFVSAIAAEKTNHTLPKCVVQTEAKLANSLFQWQELEAGIYSQRQTLLSELNSLRVKEVGLKREMELDKRAVALEKEQLKALTEQLENNMKAMKTRYEKTAEETVQR